jgi:hypothetical protein
VLNDLSDFAMMPDIESQSGIKLFSDKRRGQRMATESIGTVERRPVKGFLIAGASLALLLGFVILKARAR